MIINVTVVQYSGEAIKAHQTDHVSVCKFYAESICSSRIVIMACTSVMARLGILSQDITHCELVSLQQGRTSATRSVAVAGSRV